MEKHFSIKNFLTPEELESILDYYDLLEQSIEYSNDQAKRKLMHYNDPDNTFIKDIIDSKIKKMFPNSFVSASAFTNWNKNVELHTDAWQPGEDQNSILGYALLIPLRIDPVEEKISTIIFEQYCEGPTVTIKKFNNNEKWNIAKYIDPFSDKILNKKTNGIDESFYQNYLYHIERESLKCFSLANRYEWSLGGGIVWRRNLFHTSEAFNQKLKSKLHMIFLINFYH